MYIIYIHVIYCYIYVYTLQRLLYIKGMLAAVAIIFITRMDYNLLRHDILRQ